MTDQLTPEQFAQELRDGYERAGGMGAVDALVKRLADEIDVWHEPRIPFDGMMTKEFVEMARRTEVDAFSKALDGYEETARIEADGNDVIHDIFVTGLFQGQPVTLNLPCRWTLEGGQVTRMGSELNDSTPLIMEIFQANGLSVPELPPGA